MLAEEYGYRVLPGVAADRRATGRFLKARQAAADSVHLKDPAGAGLITFFGLLFAGRLVLEPDLAFTLLTALIGAVFVGGVVQIRNNAVTVPVARLRKLLREAPWQVWPCQVTVEPGTSGARKRIVLFAPDRTPARTFSGEIPEEAWRAMTDGLGLLWVCGDLRFTIALALPGGSPVWLAAPVSAPAPAGGQPGLVEELIRQALRDELDDWLK